MIFTDGKHLMTSNKIGELHNFARKIGLQKKWFQDHPEHPHYDIWGTKVFAAMKYGAQLVKSKELIEKCKIRSK